MIVASGLATSLNLLPYLQLSVLEAGPWPLSQYELRQQH